MAIAAFRLEGCEGGERLSSDAIVLRVYKATNGTCQMVAFTLQSLEDR